MMKYRVFIEAVRDPEDPVLVKRLSKLAKRDEESVRVLLDSLPAILAEGLEKGAAESLREYLEPVGARVLLKEMRDTQPDQPPRQKEPIGPLAQEVSGLNFFKRLSWGFEIFAQTWGRQLLLFLAVLGIIIAGQFLVTLFIGGAALEDINPNDPLTGLLFLQSPGFMVGMILLQLVIMLAGFWYQASLIRLVAAFMEDGGSTSLGSVMSQAWQRVPELITAVGLVMLPLFLGFGAITLGGSALLLPDSPELLAFLVLAASVVLLGLAVGLALVAPVAVLESLGPWDTVKRAWGLSRGWRWRLVGNLLLLVLGMLVFILGLQLLFAFVVPASLLGTNWTYTGGIWPLLALLLMLFLFFIFYLLGLFLFTFLLAAFYFEARVVSEGWRPRWAVVPHPSWPIDEEEPEPAAGRGWHGWLELGLYSIVALLLLWGGLALLGGWMMQMVPQQNGRNTELFSMSVEPPSALQEPTEQAAAVLPRGVMAQLHTDGRSQAASLDLDVVLDTGNALPKDMDGSDLLHSHVHEATDAGGVDRLPEDSRREGEAASRVWLWSDDQGLLRGSRKLSAISH